MYCVFCEIIAGKLPARFFHEEEDLVVIANQLTWAPVMLLVIPREHMAQEQLWSSALMQRVGQVAVQMGQRHCPGGFRLLSNFGRDAMQSQPHGHVHVLGGMFLGPYVRRES